MISLKYKSEVVCRPIGPPVNIIGVLGDKKETYGEYEVWIHCEKGTLLKLKMHLIETCDIDILIGLRSLAAVASGMEFDGRYLKLRNGLSYLFN